MNEIVVPARNHGRTFEQFVNNYVVDGEIPNYQREFVHSLTLNTIKSVPPTVFEDQVIPHYSFIPASVHVSTSDFNGTFVWNGYGYYISRNPFEQTGAFYISEKLDIIEKLSER